MSARCVAICAYFALLSAAAMAMAMAMATAAQTDRVLKIHEGSVRGIEQGKAYAFLGIPYAAAPVGERRWRAPDRPAAWSGIRDATHFGANCYQGSADEFGPFTAEFLITPPSSEDCLYQNVWTPRHRSGRLPVLVWIHGGGFGSGSASIPIYNGAHLAARGAVVVGINYRLGVFGFLAHPELTRDSPGSGNYALLDMIAALQWVNKNIATFGGDAHRVTIAGQSAGAAAVNSLLLAPQARGLFAAAIAESGSGMGLRTAMLAEAEAIGLELAHTAGVNSIAQLRAIPADRLLALTLVKAPSSDQAGPPPIKFAPVLDHKVLSDDPENPLAGPTGAVPLLTGFNTDEGAIYGRQHLTSEQFEASVRGRYKEFATRFLAVYPHATVEEASQSANDLARDRYMASLLFWVEGRRSTGQRIYAYQFDHALPGPEAARYGAFHTAEVPYVFGVLDQGGRPFTDRDREVSDQLGGYWLNFMRAGDPNSAGLKPWPDAGAGDVMGLGDQVGARPAVSAPARLTLFRDYVASGGKLSLF